jgi:hypothetical protein
MITPSVPDLILTAVATTTAGVLTGFGLGIYTSHARGDESSPQPPVPRADEPIDLDPRMEAAIESHARRWATARGVPNVAASVAALTRTAARDAQRLRRPSISVSAPVERRRWRPWARS